MNFQTDPRQSSADSRPAVAFDDRLWPVIVALLVLTGSGAAAIWSVANFEDRRWWANGWTYVGSLAGVTLLLIWGLSRLDRARRGLQLAAVLSLLLHIGLFLSLNQYRLMALADARSSSTRTRDAGDDFRPQDYHIRAPEDPREAYEEPVETQLPERPPIELDRLEADRVEDLPRENQLAPLAGETPDVPPNVVPRSEPEEAAPRLAPSRARLSRFEPREVAIAEPSAVAVPEQAVAAEPLRPAPRSDVSLRQSLPDAAVTSARAEPALVEGPPPVEAARGALSIAESLPEPQGLAPGTPLGRLIREPDVRAPRIADLPLPRSQAIAGEANHAGSLPVELQPGGPALEPSRSAAAALPVRAAVPEDLGGLGDELAPEVGLPNRRARPESQVVDAPEARLLARSAAGPLAIDGRAREPAEAFARRGGLRPAPDSSGGEQLQKTEAAIERGLIFLARQQQPDGNWSLHFAGEGGDTDPLPTFRAETAATGLVLLAFLGAGYDHYGGPYAQVVKGGLNYLVKHQKTNGDLYRPEDTDSDRSARLYSHGIAAIALCEAYGMTGDASLAAPAQRAIDFVVASQDPRRGGWRYVPGEGADTSVSGWQLMALKSGELAGLKVPASAYERVRHWLDRSQTVGSRYVYNPSAPNTPQQRHGRQPTATMTAVGLLMRLYTGLNRDDLHMVEGAEYLLGRLPEDGTVAARDTYYWYYATQVMFHMRGKYWRAWNGRLHPLLVDSQLTDGALAGSWDPRRPVPDRWGPHAGRIYVTAMNLLSLEVYYRHLPLYDSTAK